VLCKVDVPLEPAPMPGEWRRREPVPRLHVSPSGRFGAIVNDFGSKGSVFELGTATTTMELDGGSYHADTVRFSACFAEHDGRDILVHRTDWNRLDVSDPASGALLTAREPEQREPQQREPENDDEEHFLDYFHGALYLSPDGSHLLDDGWVWHPVGIPAVWSLRKWLDDNPWESEDGPTKAWLCPRDYYWGHGMCFIGDGLVAIEGIGNDDEDMAPGVRLFDPRPHADDGDEDGDDDLDGRDWTIVGTSYATELRTLPGPAGTLFSNGSLLYASRDGDTTVWDPASGELRLSIPGFAPYAMNQSAGELAAIAIDGQALRLWRLD